MKNKENEGWEKRCNNCGWEFYSTYSKGKCPDCGSKKFYEGPHGGAAVNVKCADCGHKFNLGLPLFVQRIGL